MMLSYFILGLETLAVRGLVQCFMSEMGVKQKKETFFSPPPPDESLCVFVHDLWN